MLAMASSGLSARAYRRPGCPVSVNSSDDVTIGLSLVVWPHRDDISYSISAPGCLVSGPVSYSPPIRREVVAGLTETTCLEGIYTGVISRRSPVISADGGIIDRPVTAWLDDGSLKQSEGVFCVYLIEGYKHGFLHHLSITIPKADDSKISSISVTAQAAWESGDGESRFIANHHGDPTWRL